MEAAGAPAVVLLALDAVGLRLMVAVRGLLAAAARVANQTDLIVAPLLFYAVFGLPGAFAYAVTLWLARR